MKTGRLLANHCCRQNRLSLGKTDLICCPFKKKCDCYFGWYETKRRALKQYCSSLLQFCFFTHKSSTCPLHTTPQTMSSTVGKGGCGQWFLCCSSFLSLFHWPQSFRNIHLLQRALLHGLQQ